MEHGTTRAVTTTVAAGGNAFASMYDAHVEEVYRFVHRRCRDHDLTRLPGFPPCGPGCGWWNTPTGAC